MRVAVPIPWRHIFDTEIVPLLQRAPCIRPIAVLDEMLRRHPDLPGERAPHTPRCQSSCRCAKKEATVRRCTCCIRDEGRPLGVADQAVIPNHPELHSLRAGVVSVCGKGGMNPVRCAVRRRRSEPSKKCR